jgi:hypothetical protein
MNELKLSQVIERIREACIKLPGGEDLAELLSLATAGLSPTQKEELIGLVT